MSEKDVDVNSIKDEESSVEHENRVVENEDSGKPEQAAVLNEVESTASKRVE
jgi:hypothetical protein